MLRIVLLAAGVAAHPSAGSDVAPEEAFSLLRPVIGEQAKVLVEAEDTLLDVAYRHRLGFESLMRLNPGVDPWIPDPGTVLRLPTRYVLPAAEPLGLVINIPEMRLYDFRVEGGPEVFAVAIGDAEDPTLIGEFRVGEKRQQPQWNVPRSIREERPELPAVVPPGPDNPLGSRWMTIGATSYGIHGTNIRWSIGREATHGCVRLYEDQIQRLYERTPSGTPLRILYQLFKWGRADGKIYLEAHADLYAREATPLAAALVLPRALGLVEALDLELVARVVKEAQGFPVAVGQLPEPLLAEPTSKPPS